MIREGVKEDKEIQRRNPCSCKKDSYEYELNIRGTLRAHNLEPCQTVRPRKSGTDIGECPIVPNSRRLLLRQRSS